MDTTEIFTRAAAATAMAGALSFGILGASGVAAAKPDNPNPPGPGVSGPGNPGNGNGNAKGNGNGNNNVNRNDTDDAFDDDDYAYRGNINPAWVPGMPPGQNPFGPPGQVKRSPTLTLTNPIDLGDGTILPIGTVLPSPLLGVPPGQWGEVDLADVLTEVDPTTLLWLPPEMDLTAPLPLVWNVDTLQWGVTVNGVFVPYPVQFPAPTAG